MVNEGPSLSSRTPVHHCHPSLHCPPPVLHHSAHHIQPVWTPDESCKVRPRASLSRPRTTDQAVRDTRPPPLAWPPGRATGQAQRASYSHKRTSAFFVFIAFAFLLVHLHVNRRALWRASPSGRSQPEKIQGQTLPNNTTLLRLTLPAAQYPSYMFYRVVVRPGGGAIIMLFLSHQDSRKCTPS